MKKVCSYVVKENAKKDSVVFTISNGYVRISYDNFFKFKAKTIEELKEKIKKELRTYSEKQNTADKENGNIMDSIACCYLEDLLFHLDNRLIHLNCYYNEIAKSERNVFKKLFFLINNK